MNGFDIPVYRPWISDEDVRAITRVAAAGWISSSAPEVQHFEREIAAFVGAAHGVATMNGTAALHLAFRSLGIGAGDEVIIPDLSFVAPAAMVLAAGARPVFADVSRLDWNITAKEITHLRTAKTKAVVVVHVYGNPADVDTMREAAKGLLLIEDVAEAFGARRNGQRAGSQGDVATFSFYGNKIVTTGEGGMLTTDDPELAERMRFLRDHAMSKQRKYFHPEVGWNYRMTALQAALGRSQLRRVEAILAEKRRIAEGYEERLADLEEIVLHPRQISDSESVFWMYSILAPELETRDYIIRQLVEAGIETRPFFIPISTMPPYRTFSTGRPLPISAELAERGLNLPSGPLLTDHDLDRICDTIRRALKSPARRRQLVPAAW